MGVTVSVKVNKEAVLATVKTAQKKALPYITSEFIKDANYYVKEDSGELKRSAVRASQPEKGEAIWDEPYARRQYYTGTPSHDKNPNASTLWAHKAYAENNAKYQKMIQAVIDGKV